MTNEIKYITEVEISGLWNKYNLSWNLNQDVNILAGINGSGKSTILDCICGLVNSGELLDAYSGLMDKSKILFNNKKSINYEYISVKDSIKNIENKAKRGNEKYKKLLSHIKELEGKDFNKIKSVEVKLHEVSFNNIGMTVSDLNKLIKFDIISTFDNSLKQSEAVKKLSNDEVQTELDWEIYNLQKKYLDYQLNISKRKDTIIIESSGNEVKEKFEVLKHPQNRFLDIIDESFKNTEKKVDRSENQINFIINSKEKISAFKLSSGEKQLLIILLTTLIQDNKPSILFMDEPEISLHLDWQRNLIQHIRELNPNVQLIIATHSPAMIMNGWQDKVFELSDLLKKVK